MGRWLRGILACLLLGAITTVIVAWGCARWLSLRGTDIVEMGTTSTEPRTWLLSVYEARGARWIEARAIWDIDMFRDGRYTRVQSRVPRSIYGFSPVLAKPPATELPFDVRHVLSARGWPLPAMSAEQTLDRPRDASGAAGSPLGGAAATRWFRNRLTPQDPVIDEPRMLPLRPLWPPFLLDTAFYAGLWATLLFVLAPVWAFVGWRGTAILGAVSTALAALTTVLIAWICAWNVDVHESRFAHERQETSAADGSRRVENHFGTMGASRSYYLEIPAETGGGASADVAVRIVDRRGWPWPSMRCTLRGTTSQSGRRQSLEGIDGGLRLRSAERDLEPSSLERMAALPLVPHWTGFAADTAVLGAGWIVLLTVSLVPRCVRSKRWRRRGQCPWCGYRLNDDQVTCPECGRERG